jgi:aspartokinase
MAKKQWNEQEIKAYSRFKELKDNHIRYKNEEREGYISFYRISGYDLSLSENAVKNQIIEECQNFWGHQSDYDIISTNILYQIAKKEYKLKKTNADIKSLQDAYDAKINQMNNDTTHKQQAYFLVLNGDSIENNEKHYATLATLIREAKINIVKANTSEISQILNEL